MKKCKQGASIVPQKPFFKLDVAREYCAKYKDVPTRTLARLIYQENPRLFKSFENARTNVKIIRGTNGKLHASLKLYDTPKCPVGIKHDFIPFDIAGSVRALILSDIHCPYHDADAINLAVADGVKSAVNMVILNGDIFDGLGISRWENDPREADMGKEVTATRELLDFLRQSFPKCRFVWKDGNHDERYIKYLRANAPQYLNIDSFDLGSVLQFAKHRIEYVTNKRPIRLGKLNLLHGHEYPNSFVGPVNPARGLFLRAKDCVMAGHWHQTSEHAESTLGGRSIACWSTGCLCELHPPYMPLNKWNHGYAIVDVTADGNFQVQNKKIINGAAY